MFGRQQDKRPIIIVPDNNKPTTVAYVAPTSYGVKPMEYDSGNTQIVKQTLITPVVAVKFKPLSIANEPWTSFGTIENRLFLDDFCHEKELTVKAQAASLNGATIKLKESANIGKGIFKIKDQVKLWFPLFSRLGSVIHFRLNNLDSRIHYDHGLTNLSGTQANFYGSLGFKRDWTSKNVKVGVSLLLSKVTVDNRLTLQDNNVWSQNIQNLSLSHRTTGRIDNIRFGVVGVVDITKAELTKRDLLVGYDDKDMDVSLKALQPFGYKTINWDDWKEWFSSYVLTAVYKNSARQRFGVQVVAEPRTQRVVGSGLVEFKTKDTLAKIKLSTKLDLSIVVKKQMTDVLSLSLGASIPLKNQSIDTKNKFGVQLDFNI